MAFHARQKRRAWVRAALKQECENPVSSDRSGKPPVHVSSAPMSGQRVGKDPVFMPGQTLGVVIFSRKLCLIHASDKS
jgi:hypothetical protein